MIASCSGSLITPKLWTPREYQRIGAQWLIDHPRGMLVADPGLGKTGTGLMALDLLKLIGSNYFPALVLAPYRVADVVWTGERDKWDAFQDLSITKIMGPEDVRMAALRRPKSDIYVINYDLVQWLTSIFPGDKWPFRIVLADECSRLKGFRLSKGTKRSSALSDIAKFTGRWWNLTGTPTPNGLQDIWGQMWFVDFGERLKHSYTAFSEAYLMEDRYTRKISLQHGAEATIHSKLTDAMIAFRAEDWLDIQKPQVIPVPFSMPDSTRARYKEMERDFFMEVDDKQIEAGTAAIKSAKLLQVCNGFIYDDVHVPHLFDEARLDALDDVLEQIAPEPLLLSYWFKPDAPRILARLQKTLGQRAARIYSGKRDEDDWNDRKFRVLLLHEQSAFGLNLHGPCRDIMHYSYVWNAELWQQMIDRVGPARQAQLGLRRVCRVWYPYAQSTIEWDVVESNFRKITVEQALKMARRRIIDG